MSIRLRACLTPLAVLSLLVFVPLVRAQQQQTTQKEPPATRLEKALVRQDVLVVTQSHFIGAVPASQGLELRIEAVAVAVGGDSGRITGLKVTRVAPRSQSPDLFAYVDLDEVGALVEALDSMLKAATELPAPPPAVDPGAVEVNLSATVTEFSFATRGGIRTGTVQAGRQINCYLRVGDGELSFGTGALGRLRLLLAKGREKLSSLAAR